MKEPGARIAAILRAAIFGDAAVFVTAALLNFGAHIPLGFTELSFPVPVWQAGIGESVIGLALLTAAVTRGTRVSWVAFWMSVFGIAFGLSSRRVVGPAREIHVILVPLAAIVFGMLLWLKQRRRGAGNDARVPDSFEGTSGMPQATARPRRQPVLIAISGLMALATLAFAAASLVHLGVLTTFGPVALNDPFPGAVVPEATIAVVLGMGLITVAARRPARWWVALSTTLFALLVTSYGLTITVRSARTGDIRFHAVILTLLVLIVGVLLLPAGRLSLSTKDSSCHAD